MPAQLFVTLMRTPEQHVDVSQTVCVGLILLHVSEPLRVWSEPLRVRSEPLRVRSEPYRVRSECEIVCECDIIQFS